jgi:hypothetical protein
MKKAIFFLFVIGFVALVSCNNAGGGCDTCGEGLDSTHGSVSHDKAETAKK